MDLIHSVHPRNRCRISPGIVGSVGDSLSGVRLKQSTPDMKMRYDSMFSSPYNGSNVQDGYSKSFTSRGKGPTVQEGRLKKKGFQKVYGWQYQDLRPGATTKEPIVGSLGRMDWKNHLATTYRAKMMGDAFLPLPGPYVGRDLPRGGMVPSVQTDSGSTPIEIITPSSSQGLQQPSLLPTQRLQVCTSNGVVTIKKR